MTSNSRMARIVLILAIIIGTCLIDAPEAKAADIRDQFMCDQDTGWYWINGVHMGTKTATFKYVNVVPYHYYGNMDFQQCSLWQLPYFNGNCSKCGYTYSYRWACTGKPCTFPQNKVIDR